MADSNLSLFNSTLPTLATEIITDYDTTTTTRSLLPSYLNATITNGGLLNGAYDAWCINTNFGIVRGTYNNSSIYSSYGNIPTGILQSGQQTIDPLSPDPYLDKLQQINWILNNVTEATNVVNNKYRYNGVDYTWGDVQLAMWKLLGDTVDSTDLNSLEVYSQQNADTLVSLAKTNGSNFIPVAGQDIGVIAKASGQQPILLEVKTAGIGDFVWHDLNANGIQDSNEAGINGVTVKLLNGSGTVIGSTITGDNPFTPQLESGYYQFGPLLPSSYQVMFTLPTDFNAVSPYLQGSNVDLDSNANPNNLTSNLVTLEGGKVNNTIDAGFYKYASLGDFVFIDANGDGIQSAGESGVGGVIVELLNSTGTVIKTTQTLADGSYTFTDLIPGEYQVKFIAPDGYGFTTPDQGGDDTKDSDANPVTGLTQKVTLTSGEYNSTLDAGLVSLIQPASLGDRVWEDTNGNGTQDPGENGIGNVQVELYTCLNNQPGVLVGNTTTDGSGNYSFGNLQPGDYIVKFITPGGYSLTQANVAADDADSDAGVGGLTGCYTLASGETNNTVDAGFYKPASIGDRVWEDTNGNGTQDSGENGIGNVQVELYTCVSNQPGVLVGSTTTDGSGNYSFGNLQPGDYIVKFITPGGYSLTQANVAADDTDSDAGLGGLTGCYTLASGETNNTVDAGFYKPASLGDRVWEDSNSNGIQDAGENGIANVSVTLTGAGSDGVIGSADDTTANTTTDASGNYSFTGLTPGVPYQVTFNKPNGYNFTAQNAGGDDSVDSDADPLTGQAQVVTLASGGNNPTIDAGLYKPASIGDRVWEDTNGNGTQDPGENGIGNVQVELYTCLNNQPGVLVGNTTTDASGNYSFGNLQPGDYIVKFITPGGYSLTQANVAADDADSDAGVGGLTGCYTLASGETNNTVDAGFYKPASIGDFVWNDSNKNGIQETGEQGISGVTVNLLSGNTVVASTTTNASGNYLFTQLKPGNYQVQFVVPTGYNLSPADEGSNDALDSDANANGFSQEVTLASGTSNLTIDAGLYLNNGGLTVPGARTPGFWSNWTEVWNGDASDDSRFKNRAGFPIGDILLAPYTNSAQPGKVLDPVTGQYAKGILIGDYNRDGITNLGENTIFYTLQEAQTIVSASNKESDARYILDRHLVAGWLNYLAGNNAPMQHINNGVRWIQTYTPDENGNGIGDGNLTLQASTFGVASSAPAWQQAINGLPSGESIKNALDAYNNTGIF